MRKIRILTGAVCVFGGACGWFDSGRACEEGAYSCDGDKARVCVPIADEPAGADGPKTEWEVVLTCEDDPVLGPLTCGVLDGQAQCVAEGADGGASPAASEQEGEWRRVDVVADGDSFRIASVQAQFLKGSPVAAASGRIAVVSYVGGEPRDAALVQMPEDGDSGTVWVRAEAATRIAVVDASGKVLDEKALDPVQRAARTGSVQQALSSALPPTLLVEEPGGYLELPLAWRQHRLRVVSPNAAELDLVGQPLGRLPLAAVSGLSRVVFAAEEQSEGEDGGIGADAPDGGVLEEPLPLSRTELVGTVLWVNVSKAQMERYTKDDEERHAAELELVRRTGEAFVFVASILKPDLAPGATPEVLLPGDFPPEIADLLTARISPMLAPDEGFLQAWSGLHAIGVEANIAGPYSAEASGPTSDKDAVDDGFASALGSQSATLDFGEYLAHASLGELWPQGPCDAIRAKKLDELPPRLLMPVAKLQVLWGLGVLSRENMVACVGDLGVASQINGIVLHKANGERVTLEDEVQGLRSPFLHGEVHVSAIAQRGEVTAVVDVMYRSVLPGLIRVKPVVNARRDPWGASVALTNDLQFRTSAAKAGLLVVTQVTRARIEAWGLMMLLSAPMFGESVYPLMTVRIDNPLWPEGGAL